MSTRLSSILRSAEFSVTVRSSTLDTHAHSTLMPPAATVVVVPMGGGVAIVVDGDVGGGQRISVRPHALDTDAWPPM